MLSKGDVKNWMDRLKVAWTNGDVEGALELFKGTRRYFERPFHAGTTQAEIRGYWQDIVGLRDIAFEYEIFAVDGWTACVHWQNHFLVPAESRRYHLDGVFVIQFDEELNCVEFRQWWFMEQ